MLGSETFRGKYVVQTMNTVLAICKQAEKCFDQGEYYRSLMEYFGAYTATPNMSKVGGIRAVPRGQFRDSPTALWLRKCVVVIDEPPD